MNSEKLQPPQSLDAERQVLGAILKIENAIIEAGISSSQCFYSPKHQKIFDAANMLHRHDEPVDIITVAHELDCQGNLEQIGGRVFLVELVEGVVSAGHLSQHVAILTEKLQLRKIISASRVAQENAYNKNLPYDIMADLSQTILEIGRDTRERGFKKLSDHTDGIIKYLEDIIKTGKPLGLLSGIESVDNITGGFQKGNLIMVAGRPSAGKTAWMNCIASNMAQEGKKVGVFSVETGADEYTMRAMCTLAQLDSNKLKRGDISDNDFTALAKPLNRMPDWEYYLCDDPGIDITRLVALATRLKAEKDVDIIFIDYLQRLSTKIHMSRKDKIDYMTSTLATLAGRLEIPIVLVSQLSRQLESRKGDKRPKLSDLKESGNIEEDAHMVIFVYRHVMYANKKDRESGKYDNLAELIVAKNRNGPIGTAHVHFYPVYTRFESEFKADLPF